MQVVALVSGGKDSCYSMMLCERFGHKVVALANLVPPITQIDTDPVQKDELDSFMFQTVGHHVIEAYGDCMGLPLFRGYITGGSKEQGLQYEKTEEDEVEDLLRLLEQVKTKMPNVNAVCSGAILSDYQRIRVENVCSRLGLISLAYLWRRDQAELLQEMIDSSIHAILIKVAAMGLNEKHLGKTITTLKPYLMRLNEQYGCNVCGEGGEYETLTLDCPLFKKRIVIDEYTTVTHSHDAFAPVGYLHFTKFHVENKSDYPNTETFSCSTPMLTSATPSLSTPMKMLSIADTQFCNFGSRITRNGHFHVSGVKVIEHKEGDTTAAQEVGLIFDKIKATLEEQQLSMKDIAFVWLYLKDMKEFVTVNSVYKNYFSSSPPSRLCVQLALEGKSKVMVECMGHSQKAAEGETSSFLEMKKSTLHVQSISCWAPACIGPYSQAYTLGGIVHAAGQIGLDPATMVLIEKERKEKKEEREKNEETDEENERKEKEKEGKEKEKEQENEVNAEEQKIRAQTKEILRHIDSVLAVVQSEAAYILSITCFLLDMEHSELVLRLMKERWTTLFTRKDKNEWKVKEEEEEGEDEPKEPLWQPLLRFLAVASLPKGAAVEIQVVAANRALMPYFNTIGGISNSLIFRRHNFCLAQHGTEDKEFELEETFARLNNTICEAGITYNDATLLRIYYVSSVVKEDALQEAVQRVFKGNSTMPPVSYIPTDSICDAELHAQSILIELLSW